MLICPKCKAEYEEGNKVCSDCKCELIEQPEVKEEAIKDMKNIKVVQLIVGLLLILFSPIMSYKLTSMFFLPNGSGEYIMEQFIWMLNAYYYSFLLIGIIICLPCILYWNRKYQANSNTLARFLVNKSEKDK